MAKRLTQEVFDIKALGIEVKRAVDLRDKHITQCEEIHNEHQKRIEGLEKVRDVDVIWERVKSVAIFVLTGICGSLLTYIFLK